MIRKLCCIFFFSLFFRLQARAQEALPKKAIVFDPKAYPSEKFNVTVRDFAPGDVAVRVIQVKDNGYKLAPDICRAWFEVRKDNRLLKRLYYGGIEPVGFSYGIFLPKQQPISDYFLAVKEGDYDGRM